MPRIRFLLFFLFLILLGGVFLLLLNANRNYQRPPPPSAVWSPPDKALRVVSCNIQHGRRGNRAVLEEIGKLNADVVLLQEVEKSDLTVLSEMLGSTPAVYHASENLAGGHASWGNAILSRHPLYDAGAIPHPGGGSFGVWATAVVDNKKFKIACVHLAASEAGAAELAGLVQTWREIGSPPVVVGGDFSQGTAERNYDLMTQHWVDALKALGEEGVTGRVDHFLLSKEWKAMEGGVVSLDGSDHKLIWLVVGK